MSSGLNIFVHIHLHGDSHVPTVVREVLSELNALSAQGPAVSTAQLPPPDPSDYMPGSPWGLARLEGFHRISWPIHHAIVARIANASINDTVATRQQLLAAATEELKKPQTWRTLAAHLAWISRYALKVTGHPKGPFTQKDLGPEYSEGERHTFAMDKSDAQAWLEIMARKK